MSILTNTGGAYVAGRLVAAAPLATGWFIAWGSGDAAWDALSSPPAPAESATALLAHLGHLPAVAQYVAPDSGGSISVNGQKYAASGSATRWIYLEASYEETVEDAASIRELAIYLNATRASGYESAAYLPPAGMSSLGQLLTIERIPKIVRAPTISGRLKVVLPIASS